MENQDNQKKTQFTLEKGWNERPIDQIAVRPDTAVSNVVQKEDDLNKR